MQTFLSYCLDDVRWTMVGKTAIVGKDAVLDFMTPKSDADITPPEITVDMIISEGDRVASTGTMGMKNKEGVMSYFGFCDIYLFEESKVKEMITYMVDMKDKE